MLSAFVCMFLVALDRTIVSTAIPLRAWATLVGTARATELHQVVPDRHLGAVADACNCASTRIFYACIALAIAQLLAACCVEWRSIKKAERPSPEKGRDDESAAVSVGLGGA